MYISKSEKNVRSPFEEAFEGVPFWKFARPKSRWQSMVFNDKFLRSWSFDVKECNCKKLTFEQCYFATDLRLSPIEKYNGVIVKTVLDPTLNFNANTCSTVDSFGCICR